MATGDAATTTRPSLSPLLAVGGGGLLCSSWMAARSASVVAAAQNQGALAAPPAPCPTATMRPSAPTAVHLADLVTIARLTPLRTDPTALHGVPLVRRDDGALVSACVATGARVRPSRRHPTTAASAATPAATVVLTETELVLFRSGLDRPAAARDGGCGAAARDGGRAEDHDTRRPVARLVLGTYGDGDGDGKDDDDGGFAWRAVSLGAGHRTRLQDAEQPLLLWYAGAPVPWRVEARNVPTGWAAYCSFATLDSELLPARLALSFAALSSVAVVCCRRAGAHEAAPVPLDAAGCFLPDDDRHSDRAVFVLHDAHGHRLLRPRPSDEVAVRPPSGAATAQIVPAGDGSRAALALCCDVADILTRAAALAL